MNKEVEKEEQANRLATEEMAKLYQEIKKNNSIHTPTAVHRLNIFFARLLFCFFAEANGVFGRKQFTGVIAHHTRADGSDLQHCLNSLFKVLNTAVDQREDIPAYLAAFPFLQLPLFGYEGAVPRFTVHGREALLRCGSLDWRIITPDIFGAMIQAVLTPESKGDQGIYYTSTANIEKVIAPLFLDELNARFREAGNDAGKLRALLLRIRKICIFDPACGSGNFLIVAYKALRKLEIAISRQLGETGDPEISLHNFYGIEWDHFAAGIAGLSLWLAAQQMTRTPLPLTALRNIVQGNATRLNWEEVCRVDKETEVYILGNPPYIGARMLNEEQKQDRKAVFHGRVEGYNDLDYIACWFYKGAKYIKDRRAGCAFVSTNSICQGTPVAQLWPHILEDGREIDFAYPSFKWTNNTGANAAVIVSIIGIRNKSDQPKYIFRKNEKETVKNISPYLTDSANIFVHGRREQLCRMPAMNFGSMPNDGGHFSLSPEDYAVISQKYPGALKFIKKLTGSREFINNIHRWCLWIEDEALEEARQYSFIKERLGKVRTHRLQSSRSATKNLSDASHRFAEVRFKNTNAIIVPATSSQRRHYLPIGFLDSNTVINNSANAIYDAAPWIFAVITSRMHMTWLRAVSGRLKSDYRYSTALCYNTFPFPEISIAQQEQLKEHTESVLTIRTAYTDKTLAQLYDPDKMPGALKNAHQQLDFAIEQCYRSKPFDNDEARLAYLFNAYGQRMLQENI
ncbi:DNA methyltransferase [Chitinophaga arvensicola]|uniref:site-specific DNA-methyltransferase (adenine-specific) n=1 Tax=Chitinophaga arvensicola TaxID=29529 RepID=A0A1I0QYP4_9BACT|nr:DNA methyltransferase [Chitinophaga arvensicola]SEW33014.1 Type II restriction/modification system, DNA methylase subunit YeeA [Chitinophaga arvensicola]